MTKSSEKSRAVAEAQKEALDRLVTQSQEEKNKETALKEELAERNLVLQNKLQELETVSSDSMEIILKTQEQEKEILSKENEELTTRNQKLMLDYELLQNEVQTLKDAVESMKKEEGMKNEEKARDEKEESIKCRQCQDNHDVKKNERNRFENKLMKAGVNIL